MFGFLTKVACESAGMAGVLETALNSIKTDAGSMLAVAVPVALGIVALGFGIKYAVKYFKSLATK